MKFARKGCDENKNDKSRNLSPLASISGTPLLSCQFSKVIYRFFSCDMEERDVVLFSIISW